MINLIIITSTSLIIVGFVFFLKSYLKFKAVKSSLLLQSTNSFYETIEPFLSDKETPLEIIQIIEVFNLTINQKGILDDLIPLVVRKNDTPPKRNQIIEAFFQRRSELKSSYEKMVHSWFSVVINEKMTYVNTEIKYLNVERKLQEDVPEVSKALKDKIFPSNDDLKIAA